jgi:hypothetical protein
MSANKTYTRLFFAAAVMVSGVVSATQGIAQSSSPEVIAPGEVNCSDGNRQMCEKIITQTGEAYRYYI